MGFSFDAKAKSFREEEIEDWPAPVPTHDEINRARVENQLPLLPDDKVLDKCSEHLTQGENT